MTLTDEDRAEIERIMGSSRTPHSMPHYTLDCAEILAAHFYAKGVEDAAKIYSVLRTAQMTPPR